MFDESLPLIDTFKYMSRMLKVSLDIIHALIDYTNKSWVTTKTTLVYVLSDSAEGQPTCMCVCVINSTILLLYY